MLRQLKIARFKSVRDVTLELGRANLFIGDNGSGKSNLLEAIGLTSACLGRGAGGLDIGTRGLRDTPPELMEAHDEGEEPSATISLEATFTGGLEYKADLRGGENPPLLRVVSESLDVDDDQAPEPGVREAGAMPLRRLDDVRQDGGIWDQFKANYDIPGDIGSALDDFAQFVIYTPQTEVLRGRHNGRVEPPPLGLHGEGLMSAFSSFQGVCNQYFDEENRAKDTEKAESKILADSLGLVWLADSVGLSAVDRTGLSRTNGDTAAQSQKIAYVMDNYLRTDRSRLSLYGSSEGTLMLLFMAMVLAHPEAPRVFALENMGDTLNPGVTRELAEHIIEVVLASNREDTKLGARQVFMTSHNPTALDAFDLFDDDQRAFSISRDDRGYTKAFRLAPPLGMTREEWQLHVNARTLSELWLDGDIPGALSDLR